MSQTQLQPDRESVTKNCDCDTWLKNIDKINSLFVLAWTHGIKYDGDKFEWCPWCGKPLIIEEVKGDSNDPITA